VYCKLLQRVVVCCSVFWVVAICYTWAVFEEGFLLCSVLQRFAAYCNVLYMGCVCGSLVIMQCVAVCCSNL